jgi:hypothetical protein
MNSDLALVAEAYLQHLSEEDLSLLLADVPEARGAFSPGAFVRSEPSVLSQQLVRQETFDSVFGLSASGDPFKVASPFLVFAVAIGRAAADLGTATYVLEWLAPRSRAPVFDVGDLRDFLDSPWRRLFLTELLASYTHVASGSIMVSTRRGWRRRRFSELDPVQLAGLLEVASAAERPGIYRRLGDLTLFLTGVFPDGVASRGFGPVEEGRLWRAGQLAGASARAPSGVPGAPPVGDAGAVALLEQLGRRWYKAASALVPRPVPAGLQVLGELPERFGQARRILNMVTDRLLFSQRDRWFGFGRG